MMEESHLHHVEDPNASGEGRDPHLHRRALYRECQQWSLQWSTAAFLGGPGGLCGNSAAEVTSEAASPRGWVHAGVGRRGAEAGACSPGGPCIDVLQGVITEAFPDNSDQVATVVGI